MKANILSFLLGIFIVISFAMSTSSTNEIVIKPKLPKATVILNEETYYQWQDFVKKGYQVKTISEGTYGRLKLVMEKY